MQRLEFYGVAIAALIGVWQISDRVVSAHLTGIGDRVTAVQEGQSAFQETVLGRIDNQDKSLSNALESLTLEVGRLELANRDLNSTVLAARSAASDLSNLTVSPDQFETLVSEVEALGKRFDQQSVQPVSSLVATIYRAKWVTSTDEAMSLIGWVDDDSKDAMMAKFDDEISAYGGVIIYSAQLSSYPGSDPGQFLDDKNHMMPFLTPQ